MDFIVPPVKNTGVRTQSGAHLDRGNDQILRIVVETRESPGGEWLTELNSELTPTRLGVIGISAGKSAAAAIGNGYEDAFATMAVSCRETVLQHE